MATFQVNPAEFVPDSLLILITYDYHYQSGRPLLAENKIPIYCKRRCICHLNADSANVYQIPNTILTPN